MSPKRNSFIKFTTPTGEKGFGVFKEISPIGDCIMYCYKLDDQLRFNLHENIGPIESLQITSLNSNGRKEFENFLKIKGKAWNGQLRRIEPLDYRASIGNKYFYIDDSYKIRLAIEKNSPKDTNRYKAGNYYRNKDEAFEFIRNCIHLRKIQLCTP